MRLGILRSDHYRIYRRHWKQAFKLLRNGPLAGDDGAAHISSQERLSGRAVNWIEKVRDEQFRRARSKEI